MKPRIYAAIIAFLLIPSVLHAAGEPGAFLSWSAGARYLALGGAGTALADDAFGTYVNPSGIARLRRKQISMFHAVLWEDASFSYFSYVHPGFTWGTLGVSMAMLSCGGAEKRDENNLPTGTFSDAESAFGVSYAYAVSSTVAMGFTGRFFSVALDEQSYMGMTVDVGTQYKISHYFTAGVNVQNIMSATMGDTDDVYPATVKAGLAWHLLDEERLTAVMDIGRKLGLVHATDLYSLGVESRINKILTLRLGRSKDEVGMGFGLGFSSYAFDYALAMHYLGYSHRISLSYRFGSTMTDLRADLDKMLAEPVAVELETDDEKVRQARRDAQFKVVYSSAVALYRAGLYKQSLDAFSRAADIDPASPDVPVFIERLKLVAPIMPEMSQASKSGELIRRGVTYFIEGNGQSAVKTITYAQTTDPGNFTLARLQTRFEERVGYKAPYTKAASGMSIVEQKLYESLIAFRKKDYAAVIDLSEEVLVLEPANALAYKRMGSAFFSLGDKKKALRSWQKAQEIEPSADLKQLIDETRAEMNPGKR